MDSSKILESNLISRDLSWINFNYRVLDQVKNENKNIHFKEEDFEKVKLLSVKSELEKIDLNSITPLEALNILQRLKSYN